VSATDPDPGSSNDVLSSIELKLLAGSVSGTLTDLRTGNAEADDPAAGNGWGADRQIRAELLVELLTGRRRSDSRSPFSIKLRAARITGSLNLEASTLTCPLLLQDCHIDEPVTLDEATAPAIRMPGCHLPALNATQLRTTGDLNLEGITVAPAGQVRLTGAHIGGQLDLSGATLTNPSGPALDADHLTVDLNMFCSDGFTATGEILMRGAHIGGQLILNGATLTSPGGTALNADNLTVDQHMACGDGFTAAGEINLSGAHIGGQLNLNTATLTNPDGIALNAVSLTAAQGLCGQDEFSATGAIRLLGAHIGGQLILNGATLTNPGGTALSADNLIVDQDMFCGEGFTATGLIRLPGAHIVGQLSLDGAMLANHDGPVVVADNLTIDQDMSCSAGFSTQGEVSLLGARIGGELRLNGATLTNPGGTALTAVSLTVGQSMRCDGFTATGEIDLSGAHIGAQLILDGANLTNPDGIALDAVSLTVDQHMSCREGFTATGEIRMLGAHIGEQLILDSATLTNPSGIALHADGLTVEKDMRCSEGFTATGEINLIGVNIGEDLNLTGASLANPAESALDVEGASIKTLHLPQARPNGNIDLTNAKVGVLVDDEESWPTVLYLRGFVYESLENRGISTRARLRWLKLHPGRFTPQLYDQLAETYRRDGNESAARTVAVAKQWRRRRAFNPLNWLWYSTVGYGYRTWLAGIWLVALVGLGTWIFRGAYPAHMTAISSNPPPFHAPVYALDILLPVVDLGQKAAWQPQGSAYLYWSWALTVAGWVLSTAVVAGLTGILKRN
jgi:hypothetical protein